MNDFRATHIITSNGEQIAVMLNDNVFYTRDEWELASSADWELVDGELRFQGSVPVGTYSYAAV